jgi:hypothetical protein
MELFVSSDVKVSAVPFGRQLFNVILLWKFEYLMLTHLSFENDSKVRRRTNPPFNNIVDDLVILL